MPLVPFDRAMAGRGQTLGPMAQPTDAPEEESPVALDLAAASIRQNNILGDDQVRESILRGGPEGPGGAIGRVIADKFFSSLDNVYDPHFDPLSDEQLSGYEPYADRFIGSSSAAENQRIKERIGQELRDREVIHQAGWGGVASSIAAGVLDPVTLASMAVPEAGGTRVARVAKTIMASAALDTAQEVALHSEQELRTAGESVLNVGAGALLSGALGTLATRISKKEFGDMAGDVSRWSNGLATPLGEVESTGGAARVGFGTTLEDETVAKGGETIVKTLGKINPLARVMQSSSKRARILMQELADVPFLLNKHLNGVATPRSAEGEILAEQATRFRLIRETDAAWKEHKAAGGTLARGEFAEQIAGALRRGDVAADPAVARIAQSYRKYFDDSRKALQDNDLLPDPVKEDQARLEGEAVQKYVKAETAQIHGDYSARTNATVSSSEFRRLLRAELENRAKPPAERAAVSEAPQPVRDMADAIEASHKTRGDVDDHLQVKLGTIEQTKQLGIEKADAAADQARAAYHQARAALEQGRAKTGEPEFLREPDISEPHVPDSVKSETGDGGSGYSVAEGELTDEQRAAFERLRSGSDSGASELGRTAAGGPPAAGWREATRIRRSGTTEPLQVFRGSQEALAAEHFADEALGHATGRPSSGLGVFFTTSTDEAARYGTSRAAMLDIRNPKLIRNEDLPGFDSAAEARTFAKKLEAQGFDGIIIKNKHLGSGAHDWIVAFHPNQVIHDAGVAKVAAHVPEHVQATKPRAEVPSKPMSRERRVIESMKLREARDKALRVARKMREAEHRVAEKAATTARREAKAETAKVRTGAQEARATAVKKFQSSAAIDEKEFVKRAERAAKTGTDDILPEVNKLAKLLADQEGGKLASRVAVPVTKVTQAPTGAKSYLPRLWDHAKIRAQRIGFEKALRDWFSRARDIAPEEIDTAVADVIDTVNGSLRGHAQIGNGFVGKTGSLKSRTLNVPDEVLEPWLVNDVEKIMESYIRSVKPQLVLKKKFGDLDMRQQMQDVRDEFVAMRERAKTNEAKARVTEEMEKTLNDIQSVRDVLMNRYGRPANPDSMLVKSARIVRSWNYIRSLGGQLFSSFPDAGRIVARHGLVRTAAKIGRLVSDARLRDLTKTQAHQVGTALEYVLNTRADTLAEIGDELATSKLDRVMRRESNRFSRLTGMASWNSALKTLAVGLEQDAIVRAAQGAKLTKFQTGQLASLGIGDRMAERIGKELKAHAVDAQGLFRANAEKWTDREAADAFEGALLKSADQVVMTKGVADVPLFMSKDLGKTLFQFKSFGMAAVNRLLVPMAQGVAHGDLATLNGAWMMMALGALSNTARDYAAGYQPVTDPKRIAIEAFDRAGFTAFFAEPLDLASGTFGGPRFGRFTSSSAGEQILGPAIGAAIDLQQTVQKAMTEGGEFDPQMKAADIYRFRKLFPYQNLFYLRRLVNAMEGEFSESVGADGAGSKSFGERLTETKSLNRN